MPPQLEQLHIESCPELEELPKLPQTLRKLRCCGCIWLEHLPELPLSLVELEVSLLWTGEYEEEDSSVLLELPVLPEGLKHLCVSRCDALMEVR